MKWPESYLNLINETVRAKAEILDLARSFGPAIPAPSSAWKFEMGFLLCKSAVVVYNYRVFLKFQRT